MSQVCTTPFATTISVAIDQQPRQPQHPNRTQTFPGKPQTAGVGPGQQCLYTTTPIICPRTPVNHSTNQTVPDATSRCPNVALTHTMNGCKPKYCMHKKHLLGNNLPRYSTQKPWPKNVCVLRNPDAATYLTSGSCRYSTASPLEEPPLIWCRAISFNVSSCFTQALTNTSGGGGRGLPPGNLDWDLTPRTHGPPRL